MEKEKKYTIEDFIKIIEQLRAENGCPWDREQTHDSLRPCMMEEAAEFIASIRVFHQTGNPENMREELGDILLQVVMHSQIASEEGLFTWEDVVQEVSEKMVRRHPHVFGQAEAADTGEVLKNWDEIKKKEKEGKDWIESPLREIPYELPALTRACKVQKKLDKYFSKQKSIEESLDEIMKQTERLKQKAPNEDFEKEIAELLWEISNISRIKRIAQEQVLNDKIEGIIQLQEKPLEK